MKANYSDLYLENQLCFPLYAASRLTTKVYGPYLEELDITYPQYLVMLSLWQEDQQSVKAIGQKLFLESNTLTPLLKRLEAKALIKRSRAKADERTVIVALSASGRDLREKALKIPAKILDSFADDSIQENELVEFQKTLFKLLLVLDKKDH